MSGYQRASTILDGLRGSLPDAAFRPISDAYLTEPRGYGRGKGGVVLAPANAGEVSQILRLANAARVPVLPYSGGTGLVMGQVAPDLAEPLILSTERMAAIRAVNPDENVMVAEAGVILQTAREAADAADRLFPLRIAAEGSARLGGNLATNAGGMNVLRYGNARELCLGIEAVLADGTVIHGLKRLRKDNTGYDLRNLLVGSEGTLGVITAASLRLFAKPAKNATALLAVPGPAEALRLLSLAGAHFGEMVSVFELISGEGLRFIAETMPERPLPISPIPPWMVLVELGLPAALATGDVMEDFLVAATEDGLVGDGVVAQSEAQRDALIGMREAIPAANRLIGAVASHDISLPLAAVPGFIAEADEKIGKIAPLRVNCFGHLGDGNLHFNLFPPKGEPRQNWLHLREQVTRIVHDLTDAHDGSFSAEHGVGRIKTGELERYGDPGKLAAMRVVKAALDPNGILNPGAVIPPVP